jgi:surface antigen
MDILARRTAALLAGNTDRESTTGVRRGSTPLLDRMSAAVMAAGAAAVLSLGAPAPANAQTIFQSLPGQGGYQPAPYQGQGYQGQGYQPAQEGTGIGQRLLGVLSGDGITDKDRSYMGQAEAAAYNATLGQAVTWRNPQTGHSGTYRVVRDGNTADGSFCRDLDSQAQIGGLRHHSTARICRSGFNGPWRLVHAQDLAEMTHAAPGFGLDRVPPHESRRIG